MRRSPTDFLRKHPVFMRTLVLGYTAFLCCFFFPLGSSPPLHRVILFGLMVLCLVEAYGTGRERDVFFRVLAAAAAGLLVRYLLEYGEVSNHPQFHRRKCPLLPPDRTRGNDRRIPFSCEISAAKVPRRRGAIC